MASVHVHIKVVVNLCNLLVTVLTQPRWSCGLWALASNIGQYYYAAHTHSPCKSLPLLYSPLTPPQWLPTYQICTFCMTTVKHLIISLYCSVKGLSCSDGRRGWQADIVAFLGPLWKCQSQDHGAQECTSSQGPPGCGNYRAWICAVYCGNVCLGKNY